MPFGYVGKELKVDELSAGISTHFKGFWNNMTFDVEMGLIMKKFERNKFSDEINLWAYRVVEEAAKFSSFSVLLAPIKSFTLIENFQSYFMPYDSLFFAHHKNENKSWKC